MYRINNLNEEKKKGKGSAKRSLCMQNLRKEYTDGESGITLEIKFIFTLYIYIVYAKYVYSSL